MIGNLEMMQHVMRSFEGFDQRKVVYASKQILQLQQANLKFLLALNKLIGEQNRRKQKGKVLVLPYQSNQLYVQVISIQLHFEDDVLFKTMKVTDSIEFQPKPRIYPQMQLMSPFTSFYPYLSTEHIIPRQNPIYQSQDRYLVQPQQVIQPQIHFQKQDFRFVANQQLSEDEESIDHRKSEPSSGFKLKKKKIAKVNDTKNITKNFSKAIISYVIQNKELGHHLLTPELYEEFIVQLKQLKNNMTNIKQLRDLWVDAEEQKQKQLNKAFRIFSSYFLKSQSVCYIYNSRIANTAWHLKYRQNLIRALREPNNFKYIKDI